MLAALLLVSLLAVPALAASFSDVPSTHPYAQAIKELSDRGLINGLPDGTFHPDALVTRQQFAKMVVLTLGLPVSESDVCFFTDVQNSGPDSLYPDNYVAVCAAHGITTGKTATTFAPQANITRAQVMSMVVRAAAVGGLSLLPPSAAYYAGTNAGTHILNTFTDPTHALNAQTAEFNGLLYGIVGDADGTWNPSLPATRGEVAQMLWRLLQKLGSGATTTTAHSTTTTQRSQSYFDDFSSYAVGSAPSGWLLRGASGVSPTVQELGGSGPAYRVLFFPGVSGQSWDRWVLKDGLILTPPYTVTVKLNTHSDVADRAGLTIAWNDSNWDRIDIQPNIYWDDIEFRVTYSGTNPSQVVVGGSASANGGLRVASYTDYWLRATVTSNGPGAGKVVVGWSTNGTSFQTVLTATGLADVTGLAGVSTAGPNLPAVYFDDFTVY